MNVLNYLWNLAMVRLIPDLTYPAGSIVCAMIGAAFDMRSRRIPNFVTIPGIAIGTTLHLWLGGWNEFASSVAAALLCGAVFCLFWIIGGMGGGDVKLIAATAAFAGIPHVASLLVMTALSGGVLAISVAIWKCRVGETLRNTTALLRYHGNVGLKPHPVLNVGNSAALRMPYGVPIAAGALLTFLTTGGGH